MLAVFHQSLAHPPAELVSTSPSAAVAASPDEILRGFLASHSDDAFSASFAGGALAYTCANRHFSVHHRMYCGLDDIHCLFFGSLHNLSSLLKQYGLTPKGTNEAMLVIEAYRTLRDRGPYPADQVVKDLNGSFSFIVYDHKARTVFVALSSDGGVQLHWGIAADGSVVISDDVDIIKKGCGKSFAPFPLGCMFHSNGGLTNFEHPTKKMKAVPRVDSEGILCGANFNVDQYSKVNSMPRVGSQVNWNTWQTR